MTHSADAGDFAARHPQPLTHSHDLPEFPTEELPPVIADMVRATATFTQTSEGMAAPVALAAVAAVVGGHVGVQVKPGYIESTNIWAMPVAPPAERKSPVHAVIVSPVLELERELVEDALPSIMEQQTRHDIAQRAAEQAKKMAGLAGGDERDTLTREAVAESLAAEEIVVPAVPRLMCDDTTPEALVSMLAEQGGRLAVISAEGGVFSAIAGRYAEAPLDAWLKSWSGDPIRVDRRGRKAEFIERPLLTMAVMVQPQVLRTAARHGDFRGSGLLARFLFSVPSSRLGSREVDPPPIPETVRGAYNADVVSLGHYVRDAGGGVLTLDREAYDAYLAFASAIEPRLGPDGDLAHIGDWAGKTAGTVVRIAGLLHMASRPRDGLSRPLSGKTMRSAAIIGDYFIAHALAAFDGMATVGDDLGNARQIVALIRRRCLDTFTTRELFNAASRSWLPDTATMTAALDVLEERGWVLRLPEEERTGPGRRPAPTYQTHPSVLKAGS